MATEKNIAALLREDAKTIRVIFSILEDYQKTEEKEAEVSVAQGPLPSMDIRTQGGVEYGSKFYSYVTHLDLKVWDLVLVEAAGQLKVCTVMEVDEEVNIEPGSQYALRWVIQKVDLTAHKENLSRNEQIEQMVNDAYKNNLRRSFRNQILAGLDAPDADGLTKLLGSI